MSPVSADDARRRFRDLLDDVMLGEHAVIERYGKPVAVIVPYDWHQEVLAVVGGAVPPPAERVAEPEAPAKPARAKRKPAAKVTTASELAKPAEEREDATPPRGSRAAGPKDDGGCHHVFPDVKFVAGQRVCKKCG